MVKLIVAVMLVWVTFAAPTEAVAQSLYKCAGVYQDRPCDSAIQSQYSGTTGGFTNQKANPRSDARCAQAGGIVQKVREDLDAGKTVQAISDELTKSNGSKLLNKRVQDVVRDVSKMRGTPLQVRYEYEGDCTDQRAMLAQQGSFGRGSDSGSAADAGYAARAAAHEARMVAQEARRAAQEERAARRLRY